MTSALTKLSINLNAVAYLRNRRDVPWPDLLEVARTVLDAGAHGITVHPRPDQRHIRFSDIGDLSELIATDYPEAEFNIEGYPTEHFVDLVLSSKAHQVTLVPDSPTQSTSDHGWDFKEHGVILTDLCGYFGGNGLRVALFVDANSNDPVSAWECGADRIELYTGPYGGQFSQESVQKELDRLVTAADAARKTGHNSLEQRPALQINAGHDLTMDNLPALLAAITDLAEVSIGHGIMADALMVGFPQAIRKYLAVLGYERTMPTY